MNALLAAGATAVVMSERTRNVLRRGVVYGLAGVITVGDTLVSAAKGVVESAEQVASSAGDLAGDLVSEAQKTRHGAEPEVTPKAAARHPTAPKSRETT